YQLEILDRAADVLTEFKYKRKWRSIVSFRFRSAKKAIQRVRPDAQGKLLWPLVESLQIHSSAQRAREELVALCGALVPGIRPAADNRRLDQFVELAAECLETAAFLCREESRRLWIPVVTDAVLRQPEAPAALEGILSDLKRSLDRVPFVEKVLESLNALEQFL